MTKASFGASRAPARPFQPASLEGLSYVGRVTPRDAWVWLWLEGPRDGWVDLHGPHGVQTRSVQLVPDPASGPGPAVVRLREVGFELVHDRSYEVVWRGPGGHVARCRFRTPPRDDDDREIVLGVLSCHNPFEEDGSYHQPSMDFLEALPDALEAHGVEQLMLMGDQMYTDLPFDLSLFDDDYFATVAPPGRRAFLHCSRHEVRQLVRQRYEIFWAHPAWRALLGRFSSSMICDDHEIVDNWGSDPRHGGRDWQRVRDGALDAFHDMQGRARFLARPDDFGHRYRWGRVALLVPDLRSHRRYVGDEEIDILGPGEERLRRWLSETTGCSTVVLVLSVPLAHVPDVLVDVAKKVEGEGGDVADRWSHAPARGARDRLIEMLRAHQRAHPEQRLVLVGGDMHVGALFRLQWDDDELPDALQLVSSAVSNEQGPWAKVLAKVPPRTSHRMGADQELCVELMKEVPAYGGLNVGLLHLRRGDDGLDAVRMQLLGYGASGIEVVIDSDWR